MLRIWVLVAACVSVTDCVYERDKGRILLRLLVVMEPVTLQFLAQVAVTARHPSFFEPCLLCVIRENPENCSSVA